MSYAWVRWRHKPPRARKVARGGTAAALAGLVMITAAPAGAQPTSEVTMTFPPGSCNICSQSQNPDIEEVSSFTLTATSGTSASEGSAAASRRSDSTASATVPLDATTARLLVAVGQPQRNAVLKVSFEQRTRGLMLPYLTYRFTSPTITSYSLQYQSGTGASIELGLQYQTIGVNYTGAGEIPPVTIVPITVHAP